MGSARTIRVLFVEDNPDDERLVTRELRRAGFEPQVERVQTPAEMIRALDRVVFDIVLCDYHVPGFGVREALTLLAERGIESPCLVCSGSIGEAQAVELLKAGASDFFKKDDLSRLGAAIERELREVEGRRERRRAENARRRSEERLRGIVENVPNGIALTDTGGIIRLVNPAICSMFGYESHELLGRPVEMLVPEAAQRSHVAQRGTYAARPERRRLGAGRELDARRKDGQLFPAEIGLSPFESDDGPMVLATVIDVTERRQAANRARALEERFQALVENSSDGTVLVDRRGTILYASPAVTRIFGHGAHDLLGGSVFSLVDDTDLPRARRRFEEALTSTQPPAVEELRCRHRDGSLRFVEVVRVNRLEDVAVRAIVLNCRDVTDRKEAQDKLREREENYRLLFDEHPHPMWTVDPETLAFLEVNKAACAHYGWTREEFLSMTIEDILREDAPSTQSRGIARGPTGSRALLSGLWRHQKRDGDEIAVEVTASAIPFFGRMAWLMLAADVTEKKVLERQLIQVQKMEAIGRLTGGVAHDFNNIVNVISGYSELARHQLPAEHPVQERLREIERAAARAAELTRQMLAFSRQQVLNPRPVDLNRLVEGARPMLERLLGEDVVFLTRLDPDLGTVTADPTQMDQVLMNLAVNARHAMPDGGTLTIETANSDLDDDYVSRHPPIKAGPYVMLSVTDTGMGMDEATQAKVFEPFFTTKSEGEGTGLGLATVYGIVKQSDGFIWVYSEPAHGAAFKIYLPRVESCAVDAAPAMRVEAIPTRGTETVLVVEDQEALRYLVREILEDQGYTVHTARDGVAALDLVGSHDGPLDLLLSDVVMPGMNGRELGERLAALRPGVRLLFMSGYSSGSIIDRRMVGAAASVVQKPFSGDDLRKAVRKALDRK